jgi:hypothetical protein
MATPTRLTFVVLILATIGVCATAPPPQIAAFTRRVQAYYAIHLQLEGVIPTVQTSDDPVVVRKAIDALGDKLRAARFDAKRGDIFTPDVVPLFRQWIREHGASDFAKLFEMTNDEMGLMPSPFVNGKWPGDGTGFMPPDLLRRFPQLPDGLEYRFANRDLVLWDSHADLILDIIPNAIPRFTEAQP